MRTAASAALAAALVALLGPPAATAGDVVLTYPGYDEIYASALDQPELSAVLTDSGSVITDGGQPAVFDAFIDTGSSGLVISHLQAEGYYYGLGFGDILSLGLDGDPNGEFVTTYEETGIGGTEVGDVTKPFGVKVLNGEPATDGTINLGDFVDYGPQGLWVRRAEGVGEDLLFAKDAVNIIGMPVISQRVMVMDPTPLGGDLSTAGRMRTHLLPPGDPNIPATNITFDLYLNDFSPNAPAALSTAANPMVRNVTVSAQQTSSGNEWLFDTGSGSTFISFATVQEIGLIDPQYVSLDDYMQNGHTGATTVVGGIGPNTVTVPILTVDEIRIPTKEGFDVVWPNVDVLVVDVAGLDGVFGMNLLLPALTVDASSLGLGDLGDLSDILQQIQDLLGGLSLTASTLGSEELSSASLDDLLNLPISPGYFDAMVFDATDTSNVELRLQSEFVPEPASVAILLLGGVGLVAKRRRL